MGEIENERNDIEDFFSRAKDKLADYGLSQDIIADVDNMNQIDEVTNNFIGDVEDNIEELSKSIASKKKSWCYLDRILSLLKSHWKN